MLEALSPQVSTSPQSTVKPPQPHPIVSFCRLCSFPHNQPSSLWRYVAPGTSSTEQRTAVEICRLTQERLACENAHFFPVAEKSRFADNEMGEYGELGGTSGRDVADAPTNSLRLCSLWTSLRDSLLFGIVPNKSSEDGTMRWHAHGMVQNEELQAGCHNRPIDPTAERAMECLLARFA